MGLQGLYSMPEVNTARESQQPKHETERKGFAERLLSLHHLLMCCCHWIWTRVLFVASAWLSSDPYMILLCLLLQLAVDCHLQEGISSKFVSHGQDLERKGRYKEAEKWVILLFGYVCLMVLFLVRCKVKDGLLFKCMNAVGDSLMFVWV